MSSIVINVENISKCYRIDEIAGYKTIRDIVSGIVKRQFSKHSRSVDTNGKHLWALKDISFQIHQGESLGIIGRNGSGKSTLLKVISRITVPTTGQIEIKGHLGALLEVGVGFNSELTGRENIYLNGTILGLKKDDIKRKYDSIVEFANIGKFLETPIKHYSSGMSVRLAFSIAVHIQPDILLVDEVLSVGDMEFQKKCLQKLHDIIKEGRTVLFVSHNLSAIKNLCPRVIVLDGGKIIEDGNANDIISKMNGGAIKK